MFRGLICQWINITRSKTVRRCIEQVWQITDCILFIIFSTWFYQLWFYQYFISSLSNLNFCHLFLPNIFNLPKLRPPTITIWSTIPTTNNGSSELGRPGYKGFYISTIAMNDYVSNFPSKRNLLPCNCKISTLVLQNSLPIPHYWWRQKHSYYNKLLYGSLT